MDIVDYINIYIYKICDSLQRLYQVVYDHTFHMYRVLHCYHCEASRLNFSLQLLS